jgi:hypothetical protein
MNLLEKIDKELKKCGLEPISDVINSKKKCFEYINKLLTKVGNNVTIPEQIEMDKYDFRIKHVLLSFGLGFILADFNDIKEKINTQYCIEHITDTFVYTWLTLCLYHDYGYFIKSSYTDIDEFSDIKLTHRIFDYDYSQSRYTYNLYEEYYNKKYQRQLKKENRKSWDGEEVGDHGILGGYILFDKLYENPIPVELLEKQTKIPFYQDVCYRIMEHNIWKQSEKYDEKHAFYAISNENFKIIDAFEPLLYILSLVDTIEMTKKFCKDPEKQSSRAVLPAIISSQFDVDVSKSKIIINYSRVEDYVKRNRYKQADIESWINNITGLVDWVELTAQNDEQLKQIVIGIAA